MWQDKCSFFPISVTVTVVTVFSQLLMIFLVSFKIKAYLCSYYKIYTTDMEQVEERYIFIFTPIHTKMTFMDVANTIIK